MTQLREMPRRELILWIVMIFVTIVLSAQRTISAIDINNFAIFQKSFTHLVHDQNLYRQFPQEHFDYFKYSPTFAALMMPWSWLPMTTGAILWNLCGFLMIALALFSLPLTSLQRQLILLISLPELVGNMQNFQSNSHLVALFLLTYSFLERGQFFWAGLFLALSAHIKIFGISLLVLGVFYPGAWRYWVYSVLWILALAGIPLFFTSFVSLYGQYFSWIHLLRWDSVDSQGTSIMGVFYALTGFKLPNFPTELIGGALLAIPFWIGRNENRRFRVLALASTLMWMIVFNHKSESPTFIIGMFGFAIYYVEKRWTGRNWLLALTLIFVSVLCSDLIPTAFEKNFVNFYEMKVWPFIGIWAGLQIYLLRWGMASCRDQANAGLPLGNLNRA